jgi:hypothetical protein
LSDSSDSSDSGDNVLFIFADVDEVISQAS